ncbi:MAG: polymer-forming cytoskeletal protein [Bdellovibrionaceae bacterium]|nr:polymer-forming cytoskeletal protein [Pseudobdellovibrionaceae bacterium]MDW8189357.1 polymer-forming cytoskeletal protein [Pseudobdellovibrionaceae bacterium]
MLKETQESLLAEGVKIEGKLIYQGVLKVAGIFEGDIYSSDTLIVLPTALVRANIEADQVLIAGKVEGNIFAKTRVEIYSSGYLKGTIQTPVLSIEEGGVFEGASSMTRLDLSPNSP